MNLLIDKNISQSQLSNFPSINSDDQINKFSFPRLAQWFYKILKWKSAANSNDRMAYGGNVTNEKVKLICLNDIPFVVPRKIDDVRREKTDDMKRARLNILRMDEYLVSIEDQNEAKRKRHQDTAVGLEALVTAANSIQKAAFREVLSVDETQTAVTRGSSTDDALNNDRKMQPYKVESVTDFQEARDLIDFEDAFRKHRKDLMKKDTTKPSDLYYLKCCLMLELQRDENESCLRIVLHDIIFKFHLSDFRLRCEIHLKKPTEHELVIDKTIIGSHLKTNYSAQFILWSGDWILQQDVELSIIIKIESLSMNKYVGYKFWDMAYLHVKNVPHGASRIFLRELTPICRPLKMLSRGMNVGQVEIEAEYALTREELTVRIIKVSHSQAERLLREPETYVEIVFQGPFDIFDIQRTKVAERSLNPKFDEEFSFQIPNSMAIGDITVDLIFLEKSSLSYHPTVLGVLTLSKHTDWFPVRKFWSDLEQNPNIKFKNSFLFEGNDDE